LIKKEEIRNKIESILLQVRFPKMCSGPNVCAAQRREYEVHLLMSMTPMQVSRIVYFIFL